jgi:tRNA threonylcarbamoyladenosine biosynthesis protein TsaE
MKKKAQRTKRYQRFLRRNTRQTIAFGARMAKLLKPGDVVFLYGTLGAGKTVLVKGIAKGLGICEGVKSPTFTIMNEYAGSCPVCHIDLYRLNTGDLSGLGFEEYVWGAKRGICVVEWAERASEQVLHSRVWKITIKPGIDARERYIEIIERPYEKNNCD